MFVKGKSGNPGGRPKEVRAVMDLARGYGPAIIKNLYRIALKGETDAAQIAASKELLDRGFGKAPVVFAGEGGVGVSEISIRWQEEPVSS